ncbi:MAG: hypothetical protein JWO91_3697 [Acidobacteriaceae bacterium]|jgi:N-acetylmuramoyl-L-alanine amidase|nr:hypothetical protein [Acidobacteriaceae bacterium]
MSANPQNTGLGLVGAADLSAPAAAQSARPSFHGYDALQALLAFSSLHEQIRRKRELAARDGSAELASGDVWELQHFVLDEVLQLVADRALAITGADGIAIALAEENAIVCRASSGTIAPDAGVRLDPNSGFSGACLRKGEIIRCDDAETDHRVNLQHCRRLGARSMVAVPLSARQSVVGLIEAFSTEAYGFNDSDVRSLNLLAELILAALRPEEEDRLAEISQRVVPNVVREEPGAAVEEPAIVDDPIIIVDEPVINAARAETAAAEVEAEAPPVLAQIPLLPSGSVADAIPSIESENLQTYEDLNVVTEPSREESVSDSSPEHVEAGNAHPGLKVVLVLLLICTLTGGGVWWKLHHNLESTAPRRQMSTPPTASSAQGSGASSDDMDDSAEAPKSGVQPEVTGIRHWSSADSSTVVIDLQDQVQYEAHRLANPERIYFDLHDTTLAAGLFGKTIAVDDAFLVRVRVAQPNPGMTRVVLETKASSGYSVSLEQHPYRLVVEIRKEGAKSQSSAKVDLFVPTTPALAAPPAANQGLAAVKIPKAPSSPQVGALQTSTSELKAHTHAPQFRIVLDAGHGGWDLGTVGRKGLLEKDLVLDIVERLGKLVEGKLDAEVIYTRQDDTYLPLEKRAEIANVARANLFLSVHANYSDYASARGVETYYTNTYSSVRARTPEANAAGLPLQDISWTNVDIREKVKESHRFATSVQRALYGTLAAKNPGLRDRGVKEASYVVLTGTSMPAILAEVSFVSSPEDETELQSAAYRQQIAEALYKGLARYAEASQKVKMASTSDKPVRK